MTYYKVKPQFDQKRKGNKDIYIADELYTLTEIKKQELNIAYMDKIELKKNEIYWCFGARFQVGSKRTPTF